MVTALAISAMLAAAGCGDDAAGTGSDNIISPGPRPGTGVGQSGAQDFGRFRGIIEDGEIPAPSTLDVVGFFNEHKIELPPADCGENVCLHAMLGVQGNMVNGANCTVALIGFNTALDPDDFERPPLNMAIAVDVSGSMSGDPIDQVRAGLLTMARDLDPKDSVTLVSYSDRAEVLLDSTPENDPERELLIEAIRGLRAEGSTNLYEGLRTALEAIDARSNDRLQNRLVFLSDGVATEGLLDTDRIVNLGAAYATRGIGITTIGVGDDFDIEVMRGLSESGSGNFYFLEDVSAVEEVFREEIQTFMVPLAEQVNLRFDAAPAYTFRAAYGTRDWSGDERGATVTIPGLFMAGRQETEDTGPGGGRRGGGGMILMELVPTADQAVLEETEPGHVAAEVALDYLSPGDSRPINQEAEVINPLAPGETPLEGEFDSPAVEKGFVTLNIYIGFKMAVDRAANGSPAAALSVLVPLADNVEAWLEAKEEGDADIEADLALMRMLIATLEETASGETIGTPPNPWPRD